MEARPAYFMHRVSVGSQANDPDVGRPGYRPFDGQVQAGHGRGKSGMDRVIT